MKKASTDLRKAVHTKRCQQVRGAGARYPLGRVFAH
jgi:hypothetical protein